MRWRGERQSSNVEDRRGRGPVGGIALGGGGLIILLLAVLFGADPRQMLEQLQPSGGAMEQTERAPNPVEDELAQFVTVVLAQTEDVWRAEFEQRGQAYREPTLVLFTDRVQSACGLASEAMGPFYCPADEKVYIDLGFYQTMRTRLGAPGDFAQAYVIAHEVGHHVQNLLGITDQVHQMRGRLSEEEYNQLSVRLELQADFLAGVWAHHTEQMKQVIEEGDLEEAIKAASAIGDDNLQRESQGYVVPDAFTHGTSEQRVRWFSRGYQSGSLEDGDTFRAQEL
ncbi:MAG: zinc metallopeptidase [Candidatus Eisenbacteria bacterium]|nr:zinc metallopeptidase [Candidatus Eisenbacteria bacterium]